MYAANCARNFMEALPSKLLTASNAGTKKYKNVLIQKFYRPRASLTEIFLP
jgi:hypothetical protein